MGPAGDRRGTPSDEPSLRGPTAKVGIALAFVTALAGAAGSLLGLPVPVLDETSGRASGLGAADSAALALLDGGTPPGLTKGPYHPVVGEIGYGEAAAKFGASRGGRAHEGQDVFAKPGAPLVAVRDGVVVDGDRANGRLSGGRGNYVVVYSPIDDRSYVYLHMLRPARFSKGDSVEAGRLIGQVGCTGSCDGPHLHFEIRNGRASFGTETKAIDPLPLLRRWPQLEPLN
jgi:murein DD-endopeptidase MepM/ murein hydrolase activator NlpD